MITVVVYTPSLNVSFTLSLCLIFFPWQAIFYTNSHIMTTFLDNFRATTRPFVFIFCTTSRPLVDDFCALTRPLVDDFCTTTRHFSSNSTPQDVFLLTNLRNDSSSGWQFCVTRHFTSNSTSNSTSQNAFFKTICALSWPLVDIFAQQIVTLHRHKTPCLDSFARWLIRFAFNITLQVTFFCVSSRPLCLILHTGSSFCVFVTLCECLVVVIYAGFAATTQPHLSYFGSLSPFATVIAVNWWDLVRIWYTCHCLVIIYISFVPIT